MQPRKSVEKATEKAQGLPTQQSQEWTPEKQELYAAVLAKVESGDQKVWAVLKDMFKRHPDYEATFVGTPTDVSATVDTYLVKQTFPDNLLAHHVWPKRLAKMRAELARPEQSSLEEALIARIVTCYLAVNLAEIEAAAYKNDQRAVYYEKRLNAAHHRYVSATIALARVRQLLAPVMQQLNIAEPGSQQLNIAVPAPEGVPKVPERRELATQNGLRMRSDSPAIT